MGEGRRGSTDLEEEKEVIKGKMRERGIITTVSYAAC